MSDKYKKAFTILLMVIADRVRGGGFSFLKKIRQPLNFGYGMLSAYLLEAPLLLIPIAGVLFWLGEKPSWRNFFNTLTRGEDAFLIGVLRGLKWGCLAASLSIPQYFYYNESPTLLGFLMMGLAFPLGGYFGYRWLWFENEPKHAATEMIRPFLFALMCVAVVEIGL